MLLIYFNIEQKRLARKVLNVELEGKFPRVKPGSNWEEKLGNRGWGRREECGGGIEEQQLWEDRDT
jgi:hypothetical protein